MADENDSDDKTEDPTQKRLDDAHDRGDVAKSQEVNTWFMIAGATLVLSTFSGSIGGGIQMPLRNLMQHRLVWSGESLKPKLSKISPLAGAKRIFGKQAAANFAKGIFKVAAL